MLFLAAEDFFTKYFSGPIMNPEIYGNYNLVSTLAYAAIMLFAAFFLVYPVFSKKGVKFDFGFALAVLPYVLFGSAFRILEDLQWSGTINSVFARSASPLELGYYFVSPGIYVLVGLFAIVSLFACLRLFGKGYKRPFAAIGLVAAIPFVLFDMANFHNFSGLLLVFALFAVSFAAVFFALRLLKIRLLEDRLNILAFSGQLLDGCATVVATTWFNFSEQHVVSNALLDFSPFLFPAAKAAVVLALLYYVDKGIENPNLRGFAKIFIVIIGFAPGIRDVLSLAVLGTTFGGL